MLNEIENIVLPGEVNTAELDVVVDVGDLEVPAKNSLTPQEKDEYAEANYSLVFFVVKMFQTSGVSYDELVSIAMVGYAKALNAYDKDRNVKFSTYAINCIKNEILFFLRKERNHVRNSVSMSSVLSMDKNGNSLSLEETVSSFDKDGKTLEDDIMLLSDIEILYKAMEELTEKERYIIAYRNALNPEGIQKTQREIADDIGMSQANVSKIEKNIIDKLNRIMREKYHVVR